MAKSNLKKRISHFIKHDKLSIIPAPDRILIRITRKQIDDLTSKEILNEKGEKIRLFFEPILFDKSYERSYQQNVSIGEIVGVGCNVHDAQVGDIAILDYLATSLIDDTIGTVSGDQMVSILAHTTYHQASSPIVNGRRAWAKGDYDNISRILGLVRGSELIPFDPYVFIEYEPDYIKIVSARGEAMRSSISVVSRKVISSPEDCIFGGGTKIFLKKDDWFDREINGRKIAVCFKNDILCKANDTVLSE